MCRCRNLLILNTQHSAGFWVTLFAYFVSSWCSQFINITIITEIYAASRGHNSFQLTKFLSHPLLGHHPTSTYPHCSYGNRPEGVLFRLICGRWVRHFPFWLLFSKVKISSCLHAVLSRTNDVVIDSTYINTFLKSLFLSPFSIISRSVFPSIY